MRRAPCVAAVSGAIRGKSFATHGRLCTTSSAFRSCEAACGPDVETHAKNRVLVVRFLQRRQVRPVAVHVQRWAVAARLSWTPSSSPEPLQRSIQTTRLILPATSEQICAAAWFQSTHRGRRRKRVRPQAELQLLSETCSGTRARSLRYRTSQSLRRRARSAHSKLTGTLTRPAARRRAPPARTTFLSVGGKVRAIHGRRRHGDQGLPHVQGHRHRCHRRRPARRAPRLVTPLGPDNPSLGSGPR